MLALLDLLLSWSPTLLPPLDGLVTHGVVVRKSILDEMLVHICGAAHVRRSEACATTILQRIPRDAAPSTALSEYLLYLTWALARHPAAHAVDSVQRFVRLSGGEEEALVAHAKCEQLLDAYWWRRAMWLRWNVKSVLVEMRAKAERKHVPAQWNHAGKNVSRF